ncbi:Uncharacterised protein [Mycobacteroides abscessus subsp. abscessus]|nr:Uncharacterised protein [Mycobacteroides abscessus subsp. abscessus]
MEELFIEIKNRIESQKLKLAHVSNLSDVSVSSISRFLNQTSRELEVDAVERILKVVAPDLRVKFLKRYLLLCKRPKNLRMALEMSKTHRWDSIFEKMLTKCLEDRNPEVSELANIYLLLHKWQNQELSAKELYNITRHKKALYQEGKNLLRILETYALCSQSNFDFMVTSIGDVEKSIDMMDESYFKKTYKARIAEIIMIINLRYYDNPKLVREYGKIILNSPCGHNLKASSYFLIAQSYLFTDIDKLQKYYNKSLSIYEKYNNKNMIEAIKINQEFADMLWDKTDMTSFKCIENEILHTYKTNNLEKMEELVQHIDLTNASPMEKYIVGLVTGNSDLLYSSLLSYKKIGDKFHSNLPRLALLKLGENEFLINAIYEQ